MLKSLFATYNPNTDMEQNTALRMQTISGLYGITVELPARAYGKRNELSVETAQRIERCSFVLALSLYKMSTTLQKELRYAISQNKPIVVIYDQKIGKTIDFEGYANVKEIHVDFNNTEAALHQIAQFLQHNLYPPVIQTTNNVTTDNSDSNLGIALGVVGIGLGLLALWGLVKK